MEWLLVICGTALIGLSSSEPQRYYEPRETPTEWTPDMYPNPQKSPLLCGRPRVNASWVCDPNGLIPVREAEVLDWLIRGVVEGGTHCPCSAYACQEIKTVDVGYRISIALMDKIKTPHRKPKRKDIVDAARRFAFSLESKRWNYGRCEEDVVILYSQRDNIVYTMTGGTARQILPEKVLRSVTQDVGVYFQKGEDVALGLKKMVLRFKAAFNHAYYGKKYYDVRQSLHDSASSTSFTLTLLVIGLISTKFL